MLHITRPHTTPTATLIETTRGLAFRSQAIQYAMQSSGSGEPQQRGGERGERGERGGRGGGRGGGGRGGVRGGGREVQQESVEVVA